MGGFVTEELAVRSTDGQTIYVDLSLPDGDGPFPVVMVARGAAGGSRDDNGERVYIAEHHALVPHGFAVATVCHRGTPGFGAAFGAQHDLGGPHVDDLISATEYVANLSNIDAHKVAFLGASRGAFMGALAVARCERFRAAVLINGYYDLRAWCEFQQQHFGDDSPLVQVIRHSWEEFWNTFPVDERSPDRVAASIQCPLLLVHGEADIHVPPTQSADFKALLSQLKKQGELVLVPGLAHGYPEDDLQQWSPIWKRVSEFLDKALLTASR